MRVMAIPRERERVIAGDSIEGGDRATAKLRGI
jgi:hypothetical protein